MWLIIGGLVFLYLLAGLVISFILSWSAGEKISFNSNTIQFMFLWPKMFIRK